MFIIVLYAGVVRNQGQVLHHALRYQNAVERILVDVGKLSQGECMIDRHVQKPKTLLRKDIMKVDLRPDPASHPGRETIRLASKSWGASVAQPASRCMEGG